MTLWVDKYRPCELEDLTFNVEQSAQLAKFLCFGDFPHLMFCGPSGAGKRTRIECLLKKLYGKGVETVHIEPQEFQTSSGKKLQINIITSLYHIELTPSDVGFHDRIVIQEIIKEAASVQQLNAISQRPFKVVILNEAENLTKDAQHALRRTMEKYASTCKIILCCESTSRIIEPLRSRCMVVRISTPEDKELCACIQKVCKEEDVKVSSHWIEKLLEMSDGNARRSLCMLEASVSQYGDNLDKQKPIEPEWELYLSETAKILTQNQNANGVLKVRERLFELLSRCIPTSIIFRILAEKLVSLCDHAIIGDIFEAAAKFEHSSRMGTKDIYHLEAFVTTVIDLLCNKSRSKTKYH